jgi:hypothetical protein
VLGPPMLGQAIDAVRAEGKLSTLLTEMPATVRADFMKTVQQSGDARAQAMVAKVVSNEMDALRMGQLGWLKYPLMLHPTGAGLEVYRRERAQEAEIDARQKELHQLLGTNTPETVRSLDDAGDLWDVQKNLIQPPSEKNRKALSALVEKLKDDPGTVAYFQVVLCRLGSLSLIFEWKSLEKQDIPSNVEPCASVLRRPHNMLIPQQDLPVMPWPPSTTEMS